MKCSLQFEPSFVEEAVFWTVRSLEARGERSITDAYHTERDSIYEIGKSEPAFQEFYSSFFGKLGLRSFFEDLLAEFPLLNDSKTMIFVKRAFGKREEGSELYRDHDLKTVLLSIQTKRILEPAFLLAFLRHEFLRVSDMLDPRFEYLPSPSLGGGSPVEENLIRDRFRLLWDFYIDRRLGQNVPDSKVFQEITKQNSWTQEELLELARNERITEMLAQGGFQCPLCGFHSFERIADWQDRDTFIAQEIERDRPDWKPSTGVCRQCYELYRSRLKVAV